MLEQTLTKGEKSLARKGREVVAVLSANHLDPDLGADIYVLDGPPVPQGRGLVSAVDAEPDGAHD